MAALFGGHAEPPYAGEAAGPVAVLAGIMALYNSMMLVNVLSQRRSVDLWRRLNRIWALSRAPKRAAEVGVHHRPF
jgi:hypothetical protein